MHELGVVLEIIKVVEDFASKNGVNPGEIESLTLEIGELASVVPQYVEEVYPAASEGTVLQNSLLIVEVLPGEARCRSCGNVFNARACKFICPTCGGTELELLRGREVQIKEISVC